MRECVKLLIRLFNLRDVRLKIRGASISTDPFSMFVSSCLTFQQKAINTLAGLQRNVSKSADLTVKKLLAIQNPAAIYKTVKIRKI